MGQFWRNCSCCKKHSRTSCLPKGAIVNNNRKKTKWHKDTNVERRVRLMHHIAEGIYCGTADTLLGCEAVCSHITCKEDWNN